MYFSCHDYRYPFVQTLLRSVIIRTLVLTTFVLAAPVQASDSVTHQLFTVRSDVLENGLHVIRHHRNTSDTFTAQLVVDVGLQDLPCDKQQTPHLLEHMLFEGTERYDSKTLRQQIRDHGGKVNGYTVEEYTYYSFDIHSDFPGIVLDSLYAMVAEPLLKPEALQRARQIVHAELGTTANQWQLTLAGKKVLSLMAKARIFANSNLACPDITSPEGIAMDDIRRLFQRYTPATMTLLLIGRFDDREIDQWLEKTFARLPPQPVQPRAEISFSGIDYSLLEETRGLFDPEVDISLWIPAMGSTHRGYPVYQIAAEYLGEQLYYRIRGQQGLAYTPRAEVVANSQYGYLRAETRTTDAWSDAVIGMFRNSYDQLRREGIPEGDVERLKRKLILEFESRQRDNFELSQLYRHYRHTIRQRRGMPNLVEQLQAVTVDDINAGIRQWFPDQPLIAVLRPPTFAEATLWIGSPSLLLGTAGFMLLRRAGRRRQISRD